jgi:hypothetical protein
MHSNFGFERRDSNSEFRAPPSAAVALTWHMLHELIATFLVAESRVFIFSTLWQVEHANSA